MMFFLVSSVNCERKYPWVQFGPGVLVYIVCIFFNKRGHACARTTTTTLRTLHTSKYYPNMHPWLPGPVVNAALVGGWLIPWQTEWSLPGVDWITFGKCRTWNLCEEVWFLSWTPRHLWRNLRSWSLSRDRKTESNRGEQPPWRTAHVGPSPFCTTGVSLPGHLGQDLRCTSLDWSL